MKVLETKDYWIIRCRICGRHYIPKAQIPNKTWHFNGDCQSPTFTPSINECCNPPGHKDYRPDVKTTRCHFIVTDGKIAYCGDCTHSLAGQTLELEDFSEVTIRYHLMNELSES